MATREEVQALLDRGNHPLVLGRHYVKEGDKDGAQHALELGSHPGGKLSGVEQVSLNRTIQAAFPMSTEEHKKRREEQQTEFRNQITASVTARNEEHRERRRIAAASRKDIRGFYSTQPPADQLRTVETPFGLKVRKDRRF